MSISEISFYKRFSNRLAFWVLGLLFVGQFFSLVAVDRASYSSARNNISERIDVAQIIVAQAYDNRTESLQKAVEVMTADYGFKGAFSSRDEATITSAMKNHSARIEGADWMMLVSLDEEVIANTKDPSLNGREAPWLDLIQQADESDDFRAEGIGEMDGGYTQILVAPLLNPDVEAWIVIGFSYDDAFATSIKKIARAELSLVDEKRKKILSSSLSLQKREALLVGVLEGEKVMEGEMFLGKRMLLSKKYPQFSVLVHKSVDEQLVSYFQLRRNLLLIFLINVLGLGVVVLKIARDISQPVSELTKATQEVERGNLEYRLPAGGDDELGHLLRAFDHMVVDLSEKERIRNLLGKVVSPEIAEELLKSEIELGGEEKCVTMIFSDIRGFTNACEGEEPKRILDLLNIYLTEVANIIEDKNGVVDKFIGDAVMALFGAPISRDEDPQNAVDAALAMESMLVRLNQDLEKKGYSRIDIGIGIHTGVVVAGNMGSENRLNYTVIGDNVNLSARLEGLTKFYGVSTIISEATKDLCIGDFLYVDCVQVKGKTASVQIFSPLHTALEEKEKRDYDAGLDLYRMGDFESASSCFATLYEMSGRKLYKKYQERCLSFVVNPPEDWKGIYRFVSK